VNSQIVSFVVPSEHEGHHLSDCDNKKVRWTNLGSKIEGVSSLQFDSTTNTYKWEIPPEAFSKAGTLEFAITFYDMADGKTAFSWNTPSCNELRIGETMTNVSADSSFPAPNEILLIDEDTKNIVAPTGYNPIICQLGDINTSTVYFLIKECVKGINTKTANLKIRVQIGSKVYDHDGTYTRSDYTASENTQPTLIKWEPSPNITKNDQNHTGRFTIELIFSQTEEGKVREWRTTSFTTLQIGKSTYAVTSSGGLPSGIAYLIDGNKTDVTTQEVGGIVQLRSTQDPDALP
jgi:hypothetical protein